MFCKTKVSVYDKIFKTKNSYGVSFVYDGYFLFIKNI